MPRRLCRAVPHEANLFDLQAKYAEVVTEAQRMPVRAIAHRSAPNPAKADPEQLEPFAATPGAR